VSTLSQTVATDFGRFFDLLGRKMHEFVDPLSTEQVWTRPFPFGNSIGHLLLHLTGNLRYYIGTLLAGTGYVRDRDNEFTDASRPSKEELLRAFDEALALAAATAAAQSESDWGLAYSAAGGEDMHDRFSAFLRCAAHADRHTGQIAYLRKQLEHDASGR
jgi:uncharacterized damage-inducible protein DinB